MKKAKSRTAKGARRPTEKKAKGGGGVIRKKGDESGGKALSKRSNSTAAKKKRTERKAVSVIALPEVAGFVPDVSVSAWIKAVEAAGAAVSPARTKLINGLVESLKATGVWDRLDRLWVFAAENQMQALIDLVALGTAAPFNNPSFIMNRGYAFDGATQYIDTEFSAAVTPTPKYSLNSASFGGFIFAGATKIGVEFGNDYARYSMLVTNYSGGRRFQINSITDSVTRIPSNDAFVGHFHGQRSSEMRSELFLDGVPQGTSLEPSFRVPNGTFYVGAGRATSGPTDYSNASISTAHIGSSFSLDEVARFDFVIRSYLVSIASPTA